METDVEAGAFGGKQEPCEYTIIFKNHILLFFYMMDEKLET